MIQGSLALGGDGTTLFPPVLAVCERTNTPPYMAVRVQCRTLHVLLGTRLIDVFKFSRDVVGVTLVPGEASGGATVMAVTAEGRVWALPVGVGDDDYHSRRPPLRRPVTLRAPSATVIL
jgi:hypothetical protein